MAIHQRACPSSVIDEAARRDAKALGDPRLSREAMKALALELELGYWGQVLHRLWHLVLALLVLELLLVLV